MARTAVLRPPPTAAEADHLELATLREALARAGFTAEGVEDRLGTHELSSRPADAAVHRRRLAGEDPFATLAQAFLLGVDVDADRLAAATAPLPLDRLATLGLVVLDGRRAVPAVRLAPHGDYVVASDADAENGAETPFDYVPGIQSPSVTLAKLAVRRPVATALDLGTGCGIQALLASRHAERVVATDVNRRALAFAEFNVRLNGVDNVELRLGSGFEPVADERFDLVVANPPYVISPDATYGYRDSGLAADELCRRLVGDAPAHLREGGFAHVLVSWVHGAGGDWAEPLRGWVRDRHCDAWLLHYRTNDPLTHAAGWLRPLADGDRERYEAALDRWLDHLAELGVEAIGYGAVVLRRRGSGEGWVRVDMLPLEKLEAAGEHTLRVFAAADVLRGLDDDELLDARLALTPNHRLQQELVTADGGFAVRAQMLELTDGLCFTVGVDRHTASLLPHLDGARPLREALAAAATTFELDDAEREAFVPAAMPVVRRLLELGFLIVRL
jgi:methylase of polypeptide subunit release factors